MTMLEELKPCPFCGGGDLYVERADFSSCYVICNDCSSRGPTTCNENESDCEAEEDGMEPGENAAMRKWNTREIDRAKAEGWNAAVEKAAAEMAKRLIANTEVWSAEYWKGFDDARTAIQALKDKHDDA